MTSGTSLMSPIFLADILTAHERIHKRARTVAELLGLRPRSIRFNRRSKKSFVAFCLSDGGLSSFYKSIPVSYLGMQDTDILADWATRKERSRAYNAERQREKLRKEIERVEHYVAYLKHTLSALHGSVAHTQKLLQETQDRLALLQGEQGV